MVGPSRRATSYANLYLQALTGGTGQFKVLTPTRTVLLERHTSPTQLLVPGCLAPPPLLVPD
eukprot:3877259-Rhodomonas_salina.1